MKYRYINSKYCNVLGNLKYHTYSNKTFNIKVLECVANIYII